MISLDHIEPDRYLSVYIGYQLLHDKGSIWSRHFPEFKAPLDCLLLIKKFLETPDDFNVASLIELASFCDAEAAKAEAIQGFWSDNSQTILASKIAYAISDLAYVLISKNPGSYCLAAIHFGNYHINDEQFPKYFHHKMMHHISFILKYKIKNNQKFGDFSKIFDYLSIEDRKLAAYHLDILK